MLVVNGWNGKSGFTFLRVSLASFFLHCAERMRSGAFGGVKNSEFTLLTPCATFADSLFRTTESDGQIAHALQECYQLVVVPTHVDHPLPQQD